MTGVILPKPAPPAVPDWAIWLGLIAIGVIVAAIEYAYGGTHPTRCWVATAAGMVLFVWGLGWRSSQRLAGVIIDNRNKESLSKLQITSWTILILSAIVAAAAYNIGTQGFGSALDFEVDPNLWALLGISTASFIGTPLVLGHKAATKTADPGQLSVMQAKLGTAATAQGHVQVNASPRDASWLDLFRGDEVGNAATLDLSKVQNFLITLITLAVYAGALGNMLVTAWKQPHGITALPPLSQGFVYLLAISHGGYLVYKSASHSKG